MTTQEPGQNGVYSDNGSLLPNKRVQSDAASAAGSRAILVM